MVKPSSALYSLNVHFFFEAFFFQFIFLDFGSHSYVLEGYPTLDGNKAHVKRRYFCQYEYVDLVATEWELS